MINRLRAAVVGLCLLVPALAEAQEPGDIGSAQCGELQQVVQQTVGDEDPALYRNHGAYVRTVARMVGPFWRAKEITAECASCIVSQFARRIPIVDQIACGSIVPTLCSDSGVTRQEVEAAVVEALGSAVDPWGSAIDFELVLDLVEGKLGCRLRIELGDEVEIFEQQSLDCAVPGVNYCGPGTSETTDILALVDVPACLNEACCQHDRCYGNECVASECFFTNQTQGCDDPLISACEPGGPCGMSDLLEANVLFVCAIAQCLNGTLLNAPACVELREARTLIFPRCNQPAIVEVQGGTQANIQDGVVIDLVVFCLGDRVPVDGRIDEPANDPRLVVLESFADSTTWRWQVTGRPGDGITPMILAYSATCKSLDV